MPSDESASEPTHPKPAAAARTAAAGVFFAAVAPLVAAAVVALIAAIRLLASGDERLAVDGVASIVLALGFGITTAAALVALTRGWTTPRPATLVLTAVVSIAWPLSGALLPAAAIAIVVVALALVHDRRTPGGRRVSGVLAPSLLMLAAATVTVVGAATANTHSAQPSTATAATMGEAGPDDAAGTSGAASTSDDGTSGASKSGAASASGATAGDPDDASGAATGGKSGDDNSPGAATGGGSTTDAGKSPGAGTGGKSDADDPSGASGGEPGAIPGDAPGAKPSAPDSAPAQSAVGFVRAYYRHLDAHEYEAAWSVLSPAVRAKFGPFSRWTGGYAATVSNRPQEFVTGDDTVTHVLVARDAGCAERRFQVTWNLRANGGAWTVTGLSAIALDPNNC